MDFKSLITTEESYMDKDGIRIDYICKGEERSILAVPPELAAALLEKNDLIDSYSGSGHDVEVHWTQSFEQIDYKNELIQEEIKHEASWDSFIEVFDFTTEDALTIAAMEEAEREANKEAGVFDGIRDGIIKIVSIVFL